MKTFHCSKCGAVEADAEWLAAQATLPQAPWKCPKCGLSGATMNPKDVQHMAYANKLGFHVSSTEALALLMLTLHEFPTNTEQHPDGTMIVSSSVDRSIWVLDMLAEQGYLIKDSNMAGTFYIWTQTMKDLDARFKS